MRGRPNGTNVIAWNAKANSMSFAEWVSFVAFNVKDNYFGLRVPVDLYIIERRVDTHVEIAVRCVVNSPERKKPKKPVKHVAQNKMSS